MDENRRWKTVKCAAFPTGPFLESRWKVPVEGHPETGRGKAVDLSMYLSGVIPACIIYVLTSFWEVCTFLPTHYPRRSGG